MFANNFALSLQKTSHSDYNKSKWNPRSGSQTPLPKSSSIKRSDIVLCWVTKLEEVDKSPI